VSPGGPTATLGLLFPAGLRQLDWSCTSTTTFELNGSH